MSADFLKSDPGRPPAARPSPGPAPPGTPGGAPGLTWGAGVKSSSASPCGFEERKGGGSWNQQPWGAPDCDPTPHASVSPFAKSTDALLHVYRRPPPPRAAGGDRGAPAPPPGRNLRLPVTRRPFKRPPCLLGRGDGAPGTLAPVPSRPVGLRAPASAPGESWGDLRTPDGTVSLFASGFPIKLEKRAAQRPCLLGWWGSPSPRETLGSLRPFSALEWTEATLVLRLEGPRGLPGRGRCREGILSVLCLHPRVAVLRHLTRPSLVSTVGRSKSGQRRTAMSIKVSRAGPGIHLPAPLAAAPPFPGCLAQ
ncbi:translation initiation factor IF-2-like [Peromyscus leucopus]|uniref:translation initiation factor IF-2-like n=1 Tax=Peromyscus leucopus TaxID=10041 RepID=UPI001884E221|nr:translation initiation factor IF-2-like [Peromyscus leucopus]